MTVTVEHLGTEYFQDPYSVHARLRAQRPVSRVIMPGGTPAWLVTGYAEARAALADTRLRKRPPGWRPQLDSTFAALDMHMLNSDPPDHERLRRLVNKAFTARRVERLRPRITAITTELLDDMSTRQEVDLLASFAFPLPITVICELLGVPGGGPGRLPYLVGHGRFGHGPARAVPGARQRADPLLHGAAGGQAARARRRPAVGLDRGPGRRGPAQRERTGVDGLPAAGGRA